MESLTSVRNTEDASVSRGAESGNLVFYSAFYRQPAQTHKKGGDMFPLWNLADKTSSTVHHTLKFVYEFLRNTSQQGITVIETSTQCWGEKVAGQGASAKTSWQKVLCVVVMCFICPDNVRKFCPHCARLSARKSIGDTSRAALQK